MGRERFESAYQETAPWDIPGSQPAFVRLEDAGMIRRQDVPGGLSVETPGPECSIIRKAAPVVRADRERVMMEDRLIRVSKYLAKYLRHSPHELGLTLQPGGWVGIDDLLDAAEKNGFPISYDDLVECVETNA